MELATQRIRMGNSGRKVQYLAGICVSLTFICTGASQSWSSPAIPKLKNGDAQISITDAQLSWVVAMLLVGALPGCYLGRILSERIGRRRTIFFSGLPGFVGALIILFTKMPSLMYVSRFLTGVSNGVVAVVVMIYLTEIADKEIRGQLGMLVQVMMNLGSLLVFGIGPFVSYTALNSFILSLPIIYTLACLWIPETPHYYIKQGRVDAARKNFMFLKSTTNEKWTDEQLKNIQVHTEESMKNESTLKELITNVKYRKALYIVACLKVLQYMTGSLAIQSYLEMIFRQSSSISGPHASIVYGFVQLGAGVGATFLPAWFGRRTLMLTSCLGVALSLTIVGAYFFIQDFIRVSPETLLTISLLPLIGILGFNVLYAVGIGNLPYVMQAELFPMNVKVIASSVATMMSCVCNFIVTKCYQVIKDELGQYTVFWLFAAIAYCGVFYIYFSVPETKGKTLEEVVDDMENRAPEVEPLRRYS